VNLANEPPLIIAVAICQWCRIQRRTLKFQIGAVFMRRERAAGFLPQVLQRRVDSVSAPEVVAFLSLAARPESRPAQCFHTTMENNSQI
jgi:hypothetical protein